MEGPFLKEGHSGTMASSYGLPGSVWNWFPSRDALFIRLLYCSVGENARTTVYALSRLPRALPLERKSSFPDRNELIGVRSFDAVLQDLAGFGIYPDFMNSFAELYIEGVT